ncbi:MAG: EAL domain-containing protein, partial [Actinomycetes bacterium]
VDPTRLHLEFTETALLSMTGRVYDAMRQLAETGIRWYVDDFGTGYSSIAHLRDLPIAGMKLDLSFTAGIRTGEIRSAAPSGQEMSHSTEGSGVSDLGLSA